jgi:hypothetical protein
VKQPPTTIQIASVLLTQWEAGHVPVKKELFLRALVFFLIETRHRPLITDQIARSGPRSQHTWTLMKQLLDAEARAPFSACTPEEIVEHEMYHRFDSPLSLVLKPVIW